MEPKVAICSKFLHFQLDFELHYMCACITLVLACKQAHMQSRSQRPRTFWTVTGMPLLLDKSNGRSGDEIGSLVQVQGKSACLQATLVPSRTTRWHNTSKARSYYIECVKWMKFGVVFEAGFKTEMAILPLLSRFYYIVGLRCYTGSNRSKINTSQRLHEKWGK